MSSVLLVCHSYPPVIGGSEIEAQRVCVGLLAKGHRVEVICSGGDPMPRLAQWTDPLGVPVRLYGDFARGRYGVYAYVAGVLRSLWSRRHEIDLVYFLMPGLQVAAAVPLAAALGKPVVMKFSGSNEVIKLTHSMIGRWELAFLRRWAGRILLLNPGMFEEAAAAGLPQEKLAWMPNPVGMEEFTPASPVLRHARRLELGLHPDAAIILFVGRLAPEKDLPSLLRAFASISRPEAQLVLVGDGPERPALMALATELGIGAQRIRWVGAVPPSGVRNWLQASDIFALVSKLEGFPVSLLEAMATGLPSVVSGIPANLQLITDQVEGLVAPLSDTAAIAHALERLLPDAALRVQLGAAARTSIQDRYSTAAVIQRYEEIFAALG